MSVSGKPYLEKSRNWFHCGLVDKLSKWWSRNENTIVSSYKIWRSGPGRLRLAMRQVKNSSKLLFCVTLRSRDMEARCDKLLVATTSKPLGTATINLLYREINEWVSAPLTLPLKDTLWQWPTFCLESNLTLKYLIKEQTRKFRWYFGAFRFFKFANFEVCHSVSRNGVGGVLNVVSAVVTRDKALCMYFM